MGVQNCIKIVLYTNIWGRSQWWGIILEVLCVFCTNFEGSALQSCRKSGRQWKINTKPQKKSNQGPKKADLGVNQMKMNSLSKLKTHRREELSDYQNVDGNSKANFFSPFVWEFSLFLPVYFTVHINALLPWEGPITAPCLWSTSWSPIIHTSAAATTESGESCNKI